MHYQKTGEGLPVVLIHGFGEDSRIWEKQASVLAEQFQLIIPDLPGTGLSPFREPVSMESMADGIAEILDHEKIKKAVVIGHSMGGYITLAFAEKHPEKLRGFGLLHSTAFADSDTKKEARRKSIDFIRQHGSSSFLETATTNLFAEKNRSRMAETIKSIAGSNAYILPATLIAFYEAMMARPDRTGVLKNAQVPVLFIAGKEDQAVPFSDTMQQVHLPELSYIYILGQSGHMGMLEETEKCNVAISRFLSDLSS